MYQCAKCYIQSLRIPSQYSVLSDKFNISLMMLWSLHGSILGCEFNKVFFNLSHAQIMFIKQDSDSYTILRIFVVVICVLVLFLIPLFPSKISFSSTKTLTSSLFHSLPFCICLKSSIPTWLLLMIFLLFLFFKCHSTCHIITA